MVDITDFSVNSDTNAVNNTDSSLSHKRNQSDGFGQNQSVNKKCKSHYRIFYRVFYRNIMKSKQ
jgi:hypothetical protein